MSNREKDIDKLVSSYKPPFNKSKEEVWNNLVSNIENKSKTEVSKRIVLNKTSWMVAASLIVFFAAAWFLVDNSYHEIYIAKGEKQEVILPDNSIVIVNSDSYLSYSNLVWKFNRNVKLSGEAYFKVMPGEKFNVITPIAKVQVLGTEFNTYARDFVFETKCFSGKVKIKQQNKDVILTKGKAIIIDEEINKSNQFSFDNVNKNDWRSGEFFFEKKSLQYVFNELGRQYNVEIILPEIIKSRTYTGYFSNKNLEEALTGICLPMQLSYKKNDEKIIVVNEM